MGCPAKKVCNRAAGSALLRDEPLVARILEGVVAAVSVPVTLKMRLGWSRDDINAVRIAKIAEQSGVKLLTVHGRTRACRFEGEVDYRAIAEVKAAVDIPVVANGDIDSPQKARAVLLATGCDAVMIGRAAQGRPWLPAQVDQFLKSGNLQKNPDLSEMYRLLLAHIRELHRFYGEVAGVRISRKHVGWYLWALQGHDFLKVFNSLETAEAQIRAVVRTMADQQLVA
jgi:tRNA-dihydrouridine synthase B